MEPSLDGSEALMGGNYYKIAKNAEEIANERPPGSSNSEVFFESPPSDSSSSDEIHVMNMPPNPYHSTEASRSVLIMRREYPYHERPANDRRKAWIEDGHILIIKLPALQQGTNNNEDTNDNDDGRNARGTYSREYKDQHPEIKWVHRGQGRYLPANEVKRESAVPERRSRHSRAQQEPSPDPPVKEGWFEAEPEHELEPGPEPEASTNSAAPASRKLKKHFSDQARVNIHAGLQAYWERKRREKREREGHKAVKQTPVVQLAASNPQYDLRHRVSEPVTPSANEERAARLARRAKPEFGTERSGRYRDEDSASVEPSQEKKDDEATANGTYTRDYVDAHQEEEFYHCGNGWYRKGPRPTNKTVATKTRNSSRVLTTRNLNHLYNFAEGQSFHRDDLDDYQDCEFHHKGNGWFKAGADPTGKRRSWFGGYPDGVRPESVIVIEKSDAKEAIRRRSSVSDAAGVVGGTVDKAYKEAHPNIEWVHRGNGRYMRKSEVQDAAAIIPASETPAASIQRRNSDVTYSKAYKESHPELPWYHTGNARYKIGVKPLPVKKEAASPSSSEEEDESGGLVDKAYVQAHPEQQFHHRGQGRYARGPRPAITPARDEEEDESEDESEFDTTQLVDTDFVNAHSDRYTFYHKGQGRWAFGLPPPGTHNKVAVRGPAGNEKLRSRTSAEEDEPKNAPAKTALLLKSEGPEKFPMLKWHYRGGGKWGRMTKEEVEEMENGRNAVSRYNGRKRQRVGDGPEAQLAREVAAAERAQKGDGDDDDEVNGALDEYGDSTAAKPKVRRSRKRFRGLGDGREDGIRSKDTSNSHSKAATPPRMLEPHEDVLTDEDLPDIFFDKWAPLRGDEDPIDLRLRDQFSALNTNAVLASLTKHDPAVRPMGVLRAIADNAQRQLDTLQREFLDLEKITAPHAKIPRRPAKGGRVPVEAIVFEDRKEADLYDYQFDPRRIGYQDPEAQKIVRDAEGRELRKRRNRPGADGTEIVPGWHFGEGMEQLSAKRQSRQPNRFDSMIEQPARRRARALNENGSASRPDSLTPDRAATPLGGAPRANFQVPTTGRWAGHVPKRIQQLRGQERAASTVSTGSAASVQSEEGNGSPGGTKVVRKGRPPGSKNLHKRRDAGIKKGPRKPKVVPAVEGAALEGGLAVEAREEIAADAGAAVEGVGGGAA